MRIHILMHESFESPGAIVEWAVQKKHQVTYTKFYQNDTLPHDVNELDFLVIMGGPQCPDTTKSECPHFHVKEEILFIQKAINADKKILGVCLGAQLIGEALGARYDHSPEREIGLFNVVKTPDAQSDPIFKTFPDTFKVGHWHGDMPGLTKDAVVLATSKGCPRQIVRYSPKIYGFQCHFEFTKQTIEEMIQNSQEELYKYKGLPFVEDENSLRKHNFTPVNNLLFSFLDYIANLE